MRVPGLQKMLERRNMQHPTMLVVVGQRCWVRLHGAKAAVNTRQRYLAQLIVINLPYH